MSEKFDKESIEEFLSKVDDVQSKIRGLIDGSIDIEEIDR